MSRIRPETKEFLAGFWIVDVETPACALEIAARQHSQAAAHASVRSASMGSSADAWSAG